MKKGILIIGLFMTVFTLLSSQELYSQTGNPWDGPRWTSVKVANTVMAWITDNGHVPNEEGEWWSTDYNYMGRGTWQVIISWGIGGLGGTILGTETLLIRNNGDIIN